MSNTDTNTMTTETNQLNDARAAASQARMTAAQQGSSHYIGMPCRKCASPLRYTRSTMCVMCARAKQNAARKHWTSLIEQNKATQGS